MIFSIVIILLCVVISFEIMDQIRLCRFIAIVKNSGYYPGTGTRIDLQNRLDGWNRCLFEAGKEAVKKYKRRNKLKFVENNIVMVSFDGYSYIVKKSLSFNLSENSIIRIDAIKHTMINKDTLSFYII